MPYIYKSDNVEEYEAAHMFDSIASAIADLLNAREIALKTDEKHFYINAIRNLEGVVDEVATRYLEFTEVVDTPHELDIP